MPRAKPRRTKRAPKKRTKPDWSPAFLAALAQSGNITEACKLTKVGRTTFYERRNSDPAFQSALKDAFAVATDALEAEARRRAMAGDSILLMFLLKAHRPKKFRERHEVKHKGRIDSGVQLFLTEEIVDAGNQTATS